MKKEDKAVLAKGLMKLSTDIAELAALFDDEDSSAKKPEPEAPTAEPKTPARTYSYEEVRAILAEKARTGYRAEVKALITRYGAAQLSDIKVPEVLNLIAAEAEEIGSG